ncbi:methylaspartate mutase subunit S [Acrocarpospora macrocephala]|uniref:methylaspartate mutase subunit S n=1 Tax=Acrocarpospora macrocephala TaxID=150177 RepID=UPI001C3F5789|nr:methylaspartate mutase subunit S [Acrocarpospora macrocephala]
MTSVLRRIRVVVGSIGDDIHVVGITLLGHALRNAGADVIQLGIQTSPAEFVAAAVTEDADAVFVSSSNGHAGIFCPDLVAGLREAGADPILYVGGNLSVSAATPWDEVRERFARMGFDRVYPPRTLPDQAVRDLAADLRARGSSDLPEQGSQNV